MVIIILLINYSSTTTANQAQQTSIRDFVTFGTQRKILCSSEAMAGEASVPFLEPSHKWDREDFPLGAVLGVGWTTQVWPDS